jgi:rhodanese-related sulfurtransferase
MKPMKPIIRSAVAGVASLLASQLFAQLSLNSVTVDDMRQALESHSAVVIDIREPFEHATGVAKGAILMPMSGLTKRLAELPKSSNKPLLVICNTQNRSTKIVEQLQAAGFTNARYVQGGMSQWNARGLTTIKPQ